MKNPKSFLSEKDMFLHTSNIHSNNTLANKNIIKYNQGHKKDVKVWNC